MDEFWSLSLNEANLKEGIDNLSAQGRDGIDTIAGAGPVSYDDSKERGVDFSLDIPCLSQKDPFEVDKSKVSIHEISGDDHEGIINNVIGGELWEASLLLTAYLTYYGYFATSSHRHNNERYNRVLEIGSGVGLCGLYALSRKLYIQQRRTNGHRRRVSMDTCVGYRRQVSVIDDNTSNRIQSMYQSMVAAGRIHEGNGETDSSSDEESDNDTEGETETGGNPHEVWGNEMEGEEGSKGQEQDDKEEVCLSDCDPLVLQALRLSVKSIAARNTRDGHRGYEEKEEEQKEKEGGDSITARVCEIDWFKDSLPVHYELIIGSALIYCMDHIILAERIKTMFLSPACICKQVVILQMKERPGFQRFLTLLSDMAQLNVNVSDVSESVYNAASEYYWTNNDGSYDGDDEGFKMRSIHLGASKMNENEEDVHATSILRTERAAFCVVTIKKR